MFEVVECIFYGVVEWVDEGFVVGFGGENCFCFYCVNLVVFYVGYQEFYVFVVWVVGGLSLCEGGWLVDGVSVFGWNYCDFVVYVFFFGNYGEEGVVLVYQVVDVVFGVELFEDVVDVVCWNCYCSVSGVVGLLVFVICQVSDGGFGVEVVSWSYRCC